MSDETTNSIEPMAVKSAWQATKLICCGVVVISVLSCVDIAVYRSNGLTQVTVTALKAKAEPRDHRVPFMKKVDALPDYEIVVNLNDGSTLNLGAKPNTLAINELTWTLNDPVSISEVAGVRLQDQDKMVLDTIVEVQITADSVSSTDYRFDFRTERSLSVGIKSFFNTPIGLAISADFFIAILLMLLSAL